MKSLEEPTFNTVSRLVIPIALLSNLKIRLEVSVVKIAIASMTVTRLQEFCVSSCFF